MTQTAKPSPRRLIAQRGFALLIVLWSLVLLSVILTQLLAAGRSEAQLAGNLRNAAVAEEIANGAVQETLFHLVARGNQNWSPSGQYAVRIGKGRADIRVEPVSGKVNPNTVAAQLLNAMLGLCGASAAQTAQLTQAIFAWRGTPTTQGDDPTAAYRAAGLGYAPPGMPMQSLDELGLVLGMTPPILACLQPHMSLFQRGPDPSGSTDTLIARALAIAAEQGYTPVQAPPGPVDVVEISATATAGSARFVRRATARLTTSGAGRPVQILSWESGTKP